MNILEWIFFLSIVIPTIVIFILIDRIVRAKVERF